MKYVIGIDVGTSGTKTVLFDEKGAVIASATIEYPMSQPQNGWAEQDPADWWNASAKTVKAVIEKSGVDASLIAGVGISGQMHGLVMLDGDGAVLRPSIIWCDQRTAEECADIERLIGGREELIRITANPALTGFTASKIMWVKKHEPEVYEKCRRILLPKDYIRYMLTGVFATEVSDASGMQLLDVPGRCWSDELLAALGIEKSLLADVYESPEITGLVNDEAAALTGLKPGTPVVGGAGDNAAAAVGMGVVEDGLAFTTVGTSGVVFAHTDKITVDPKGRVHTFCCAVPGAWHVMGVTQAAGLSLRWLRGTVCAPECAEAEKQGVDPYKIMDAEAAESPVGANRLLYMPYLMGERTPHLDPNVRGGFVGLSAM
ncbi:MAG: xylulokinase, partial [Clostridia bacterium]|nr:xylulokinase [Clostridia bacterium]